MARDRIVKLEAQLAQLYQAVLAQGASATIDREVVELVWNLLQFHVANQLEFERVPPDQLLPLIRELDSYQTSIQDIVVRLQSLSSPLLVDQLCKRLASVARAYAERLGQHAGRLASIDFGYLAVLVEALDGVAERDRPRTSREAAGLSAAVDLYTVYGARAQSEKLTADVLRGLAVLTLVATVAAVLLVASSSRVSDVGSSLQHLSISIPGLTLFGYFANQSRVHRNEATRLSDVAIRLETVDAFCERLDSAARSEILANFGRSLFVVVGEDAAADVDKTNISSLDSLLSVIERLQSLGPSRTPPPPVA